MIQEFFLLCSEHFTLRGIHHPDSVNGAPKKLKMATRVTLEKLNLIYLFKDDMVTRFAPENIFA